MGIIVASRSQAVLLKAQIWGSFNIVSTCAWWPLGGARAHLGRAQARRTWRQKSHHYHHHITCTVIIACSMHPFLKLYIVHCATTASGHFRFSRRLKASSPSLLRGNSVTQNKLGCRLRVCVVCLTGIYAGGVGPPRFQSALFSIHRSRAAAAAVARWVV